MGATGARRCPSCRGSRAWPAPTFIALIENWYQLPAVLRWINAGRGDPR